MSITKERKKEVMQEFRRTESDTGSPEVQIAVLSKRIETLTLHLKDHHKDHSSRRGLLGLVSRRRRLLDFMKKRNLEGYQQIIAKLGIRK